MRTITSIFFLSICILFNSCSKSDDPSINEDPEIVNTLDSFKGEWELKASFSDDVEEILSIELYMTIRDNGVETDDLGILDWIYPQHTDSYDLQIKEAEEIMYFWRIGLSWTCYYSFDETDQLIMVDSFPGGPVVKNIWARVE